MNVPKLVALCNHDFRQADDLPTYILRCVKCASAGYESLQTQYEPCNGNCRCGGNQ